MPEQEQLLERIHALEVSQAGQAATMAGAQATQAAAQAGTWATIASGSASLVIGIIVGLMIGKAR